MAFKAKDGRAFTNRPAMVAHEARTEHASKHAAPHAAASNMVTCPACGAEFDAASPEKAPQSAETVNPLIGNTGALGGAESL